MSSYKLFGVQALAGTHVPFIVTTAYQNTGGYLKGEWFLVFQDESKAFFGQAIKFSYKEFPEGGVKLDEDFVHKEMLILARRRLRKYVLDNVSAAPFGRNGVEPQITEVESDSFAHIWVRKGERDQLVKLYEASACDELREVLHWASPIDPYEVRDL